MEKLWKTRGIIIRGLDKHFLFKEDYPLNEIKNIIEDSFIVWSCRKSQCQQTCYLFSKKTQNENCLLMKRILENFIQTTSNFVDSEDQNQVESYIRSAISLILFFKLSEEWKAELSTNWGNWYYKGIHTWHNDKNSKRALEFIHEFVQNFDFIDKDIEKKYLIFVEGVSELESLKILSYKLDLSFGLNSKIFSLDGKDNASKNKLRNLLKMLKERKNDFFIILDGADENTKKYRDDLVREGLIKNNHFVLWEKEFEDTFPPEIIFNSLKDVAKDIPFEINQLKEEIKKDKKITASIKKLFYAAGKKINYDNIKVKVALKASELLDKDANCELLRKIRKIKKIIESEKNKYYFRDPSTALKGV